MNHDTQNHNLIVIKPQHGPCSCLITYQIMILSIAIDSFLFTYLSRLHSFYVSYRPNCVTS